MVNLQPLDAFLEKRVIFFFRYSLAHVQAISTATRSSIFPRLLLFNSGKSFEWEC
jgi:hypothetical protein